jgi:hypothetical protein
MSGSKKAGWEATPAGRVFPAVEALYRPVWYIRDRNGDEAVDDFLDWWGKELSEELRDMGVRTHFELANWFAVRERQLYGSDVEVDGQETSSTLTVRNCTRLACALEWKGKARSNSPAKKITQEEYCKLCTTVYLMSPAQGLGFEHESEHTKTGCVQAFHDKVKV